MKILPFYNRSFNNNQLENPDHQKIITEINNYSSIKSIFSRYKTINTYMASCWATLFPSLDFTPLDGFKFNGIKKIRPIPFLIYFLFTHIISSGTSIILEKILAHSNSEEKTAIFKNLNRKKDDQSKSNATIFLASDDWNGAFQNKLEWLRYFAKKYNLDIHYVTSIKCINNILSQKKYSLIFIAAHGTKDSMIFNKSFVLKTNEINKIHFKNLRKDCEIVLNSCSTGKVNGIAEKIAELSKRRVFAPMEPAGVTQTLAKDGNIKYTYKKPPLLPFFKAKDVTRRIDPYNQSYMQRFFNLILRVNAILRDIFKF